MTEPPRTARAVRAQKPGGPEELVVVQAPVERPGVGELLIKVAAAGVNRPDLLQRMGFYPPPKGVTDVLGLEVSGHVAEVGAGVDAFQEGDAVVALLPGGGYAEYAVVDAGSALPAPKGVALRDAAGLPETVFTVWANVFERAHLKPGETFLVHGGAGGIGAAAIQMAAAHGAQVLATAGAAQKCALCERLGAARAINYKAEDFVAVLNDLGGADVILDMVGGDYVARNIAALKEDGRLVNIAFLKGSTVEVDLLPVMLKRLTLTGSTLRMRPASEKARLARAVKSHVWPWIEDGHVRPVIDACFALADAADAHRRMERSDHAGKMLLAP